MSDIIQPSDDTLNVLNVTMEAVAQSSGVRSAIENFLSNRSTFSPSMIQDLLEEASRVLGFQDQIIRNLMESQLELDERTQAVLLRVEGMGYVSP